MSVVERRPSGGSSIQDSWCPSKRRKCAPRPALKENVCEDGAETRGPCCSPGPPETPADPRSWERGLEETLPHSCGRNQPCQHLDLGLQATIAGRPRYTTLCYCSPQDTKPTHAGRQGWGISGEIMDKICSGLGDLNQHSYTHFLLR